MVKKRFFIGFNGILLGIYVSFLLFEMILFLIMRYRKSKHILGQVLQRLVLIMSDYGDIYVTIFLKQEVL